MSQPVASFSLDLLSFYAGVDHLKGLFVEVLDHLHLKVRVEEYIIFFIIFVQVLSGHDVVFKNNKIVASPIDYGGGAPQDCHTYQDVMHHGCCWRMLLNVTMFGF